MELSNASHMIIKKGQNCKKRGSKRERVSVKQWAKQSDDKSSAEQGIE